MGRRVDELLATRVDRVFRQAQKVLDKDKHHVNVHTAALCARRRLSSRGGTGGESKKYSSSNSSRH